jgi:alcohol dehydrogenase (cytochrome c)
MTFMEKFSLAACWRMAACILFFSGAVGWADAAAAQPAPAAAGSAGEASPVRPANKLPESFSMHPVSANVDVSDAQRLDADGDFDNWLLNGRTYDNKRFSPLTQINAANVDKLKPVALIQTGVQNSFEDTPIVVDGIMYVETAFNHVMAYDAVTGVELWSYIPSLEFSNLCCGPQARGVVLGYGKVFVAQLDGYVVALDARTGKLLWKTDKAALLPQPTQFYSFTMAPQLYNGLVIVGNAGAEWPTRGFVQALNAETGKFVWRFDTTAAPDQPGGNSWSGDSWKYGGGSVWDTPAVDPKNGLILFATGNASPDLYGEFRKGDNAYTASIVAIHAKTGKLAWWYQEVRHDLWDYDASAPVVLFDTLDEKGHTVPAAAQAGKVGSLFIVNRLTGKLIRKSAPFVDIGPNFLKAPTETPAPYLPGNRGGATWSPPAFSPKNGLFYTMGLNEVHLLSARPVQPYVPGSTPPRVFLGGSMALDLKNYPPSGTFSAIDVATGKIAWQYKASLPMYGGALATESDLVFAGEMDGNFDAFDAGNGKLLWQYNLGVGVCTPPVTYRVKGVQYVAVGAGGCHGAEEMNRDAGRPQFGDLLAIFAVTN